MRLNLPLVVLSLTLCAAEAAAGQRGIPKVRTLGQPDAVIPLGMNGSPFIRVTSAGRLIVADVFNRRVATVDPDLTKVDTLFDATTAPPLTYSGGFAMLVPAPGDTTLFFDAAARGFRVIDPSGRVVRRLGIADANLQRPLQAPSASAIMDTSGRLVFATQRQNFEKPVSGVQPQAESLMVLRVRPSRLGWDSVTAVRGSGQSIVQVGDTSLKPRPAVMHMSAVDNGDAWAALWDGTVAVVRGSDFHVDWYSPDGSRRSTPPVPWPWKKYSRAERDSLRASVEALYNSANIRAVSSTGAMSSPPVPMTRVIDTVAERVPAIASSTARVDPDGRIWIELGPRAMGPRLGVPTVYGVIDQKGQLIDRVELPERRILAGFGSGGAVYVIAPPRPESPREGFVVERYQLRKP